MALHGFEVDKTKTIVIRKKINAQEIVTVTTLNGFDFDIRMTNDYRTVISIRMNKPSFDNFIQTIKEMVEKAEEEYGR